MSEAKMTIDDEFKIWLSKTLDAKFAAQEAAIREMLLSLATAGFEQEISKGAGVASMPLSEISDLVPKMELEFGEKDDKESETGSPGVQAPVPRLGKHILSEKLAPDPPFKVFVKRSLDSYMSLVVIINLVFIAAMTEFQAAQADYGLGMAKHTWHGVSENTFEVAEYVFFSIYFFDLVVRLVILRKEWYYDRIEGWMYLNMFDAVLVMINIFELFALPALYMGDQHQNATPIRVIKLVRIIRTLRIFKTVSLFRQLRILVGTCVASIGALFWSMVLLMVLQIGFALAICQALQLFIADEREELADRLEMRQYYGNFLKTVYTMFEITFSGSWPARVRPVTSKVSGWYAIPFLSYIALVVFAVKNRHCAVLEGDSALGSQRCGHDVGRQRACVQGLSEQDRGTLPIGGQRRGRPPHPSGVHGNDEPSKCAALPEGFGCDGQRFSYSLRHFG